MSSERSSRGPSPTGGRASRAISPSHRAARAPPAEDEGEDPQADDRATRPDALAGARRASRCFSRIGIAVDRPARGHYPGWARLPVQASSSAGPRRAGRSP